MMSVSKMWVLIVALLLAAPTVLLAAEEKPKTLAEAKTAFAKADKALNDAWAAAKKTLGESEFAELQGKQRNWLKYREDLSRGANRDNGEPEGKQSAWYYDTAATMTESRADWLRARIKNEDDSLTGVWTDSYGGTLEIVQEKEKLFFGIEVVRGPTFHTGSLAGVATWNSPIGWFTDKGHDKEKTDETNLAFVSRGTVLEIIGANTSYYHGARAYFDGGYCKTGQLDEKAKAALLKAAESGGVEEK